MEYKRDPVPLSKLSIHHVQRMLDVIADDLAKQRGTEIRMIARKKDPKEKDAQANQSVAS